jgi:hypothetical protein
MRGLIDDFVREEILYREAVASGLDQNDTVIRRHLAQKVEFLAQSDVTQAEPTETELADFFRQHVAKYLLPARAAFAHVYFKADRGPGAQTAAAEALSRLNAPASTVDAATLGDRFMDLREYPPQTREEMRNVFGPVFAARLFELAPGKWEGPIESSYGLHLVRVREVVPAHEPSLDEVRDQVLIDFKAQRLQSAIDSYYDNIRKRYRVDIDQQALK